MEQPETNKTRITTRNGNWQRLTSLQLLQCPPVSNYVDPTKLPYISGNQPL